MSFRTRCEIQTPAFAGMTDRIEIAGASAPVGITIWGFQKSSVSPTPYRVYKLLVCKGTDGIHRHPYLHHQNDDQCDIESYVGHAYKFRSRQYHYH